MLVKINSVAASYKPIGRTAISALSDANLKVAKGEIVGLIGQNGAGKTTLIRVILGLISPEKGDVSVLGMLPSASRHKILRDVGAILEGERELIARWTLDAVAKYTAVCYGLDNKTIKHNIDELFEKFDLTAHRAKMVTELSRGMRQKLALTLALLHRPKLLILDEPTLGMDVGSAQEFYQHLKEVVSEGTGVIISSHQLNAIRPIVDNVVVINKGATIFEGQPDVLIASLGQEKLRLSFDDISESLVEVNKAKFQIEDNSIIVPKDSQYLAEVFSFATKNNLTILKIEDYIDFEHAFLELTEREVNNDKPLEN